MRFLGSLRSLGMTIKTEGMDTEYGGRDGYADAAVYKFVFFYDSAGGFLDVRCKI